MRGYWRRAEGGGEGGREEGEGGVWCEGGEGGREGGEGGRKGGRERERGGRKGGEGERERGEGEREGREECGIFLLLVQSPSVHVLYLYLKLVNVDRVLLDLVPSDWVSDVVLGLQGVQPVYIEAIRH